MIHVNLDLRTPGRQSNGMCDDHQTTARACLPAVKKPDPDKQLEIVAQLNRLLQGSKKATSIPLTRVAKQGR